MQFFISLAEACQAVQNLESDNVSIPPSASTLTSTQFSSQLPPSASTSTSAQPPPSASTSTSAHPPPSASISTSAKSSASTSTSTKSSASTSTSTKSSKKRCITEDEYMLRKLAVLEKEQPLRERLLIAQARFFEVQTEFLLKNM